MNKSLVLPVMLMLSTGLLPAAEIVWSQNFQSMTPGDAPVGPGIATTIPVGTQVVIVDDATPVLDPFGPTGNQSLMLEKLATGAHPGVTFEFGQSYNSGVFTLDLYSFYENPGFTMPLLVITFFDGSTSSNDIGAWLWLSDTTIYVQDGATTLPAFGAWKRNMPGELQIEFFENSTFSVTVDGNLLTAGSKTVFDYYGSGAAGADRVALSIGDTGTNEARIFIDDLSLVANPIPEPATLVLLGLAGAALLLRCRRL